MSSKRSTSLAFAVGSKKPCLQHTFQCPHPDCTRSSKSANGLRQHFSKSPSCKAFRMNSTRKPSKACALPPSQPINASEELNEYPWDDDDSLIESDSSIGLSDDNNSYAPNELNQHNGVFAESANDQALRYGCRFTSAQYHETKLLKILSDANAAHYLYKDITEWGRVAREDDYHFNPSRSTQIP